MPCGKHFIHATDPMMTTMVETCCCFNMTWALLSQRDLGAIGKSARAHLPLSQLPLPSQGDKNGAVVQHRSVVRRAFYISNGFLCVCVCVFCPHPTVSTSSRNFQPVKGCTAGMILPFPPVTTLAWSVWQSGRHTNAHTRAQHVCLPGGIEWVSWQSVCVHIDSIKSSKGHTPSVKWREGLPIRSLVLWVPAEPRCGQHVVETFDSFSKAASSGHKDVSVRNPMTGRKIQHRF